MESKNDIQLSKKFIDSFSKGMNDNFEEIIDNLIKDEEEAIAGYEKAIEELPELADKLNHIKEEEQEHIRELEEIKYGK